MKRSEFLKLIGLGGASVMAGVSASSAVSTQPFQEDRWLELYNKALRENRIKMERAYLYGHMDASKSDDAFITTGISNRVEDDRPDFS